MQILSNYTRFKISGHILFWICSFIFAVTAFYVASDQKLILNSNLLLRAFIPNLWFAAAVYINAYLLIPKLLKNNKYIFYTFGLVILLSLTSLLIQIMLALLVQNVNFGHQLKEMFPSHFFTAAFYVGLTSLFKFVKDWLELQEMKLNYAQIERQKLEAELNTLKSQLNPHFLFNCLNNIYSLALTKSPQTPDIILKLSDLMRHVLYESRENFIPVKQELEFLSNFIELQKIRLSDKIEISYQIEGIIPDRTIIPLIFEPFIDNAFKHGLRNPAPSPFIEIKIHFTDEKMLFQLTNNYSGSQHREAGKNSGIGLQNIETRLKYLYQPDEYNYEIIKNENTFAVKLEIKLKAH
jgi:sensor histidine kinase YesM